MNLRRFALILLCCSGLIAAYAQSTDAAAQLPKRIVADYGYWTRTQNPPYSSEQIPFHRLTHINHAGISVNADGSLTVPQGFPEPNLLVKAHAAGVKVMLLLGGAFTAIEQDPNFLNTMITNLHRIIDQGYDGVDVDWEYPNGTADRKAFYELMVSLRRDFPSPRYVLSADVPPWAGGGYDLEGVEPLVDYYNIMMYDCAGPWTQHGQLNSAIFWDPKNPAPEECEPGGSASQTADIFLNTLHLPPSKLNMGTPFYGYFYKTVSALFGTCDPACDDSNVLGLSYGTFFKPRVNKLGWKTYYDQTSLVPYMLRADGKPGFITYDNPFSTYHRVFYADWTRGMGGTFMWSLDADYDGHSQDLLDAMYRATVAGAGR